MGHCNVTAMQFGYTQGIKALQRRNSANSDDKGEYRIANLSAGKYYVLARCPLSIPLPHAFIRRGLDIDVPYQTYAPVFYPGTPDLAGAARVPTTPGADVTDIDVRLNPAGGVTVRGHVSGADLEALPRTMQLSLESRDRLRREWLGDGTGFNFNRQAGSFSFQHVLPGAYEIIAATIGEGTPYYARVPIDVGSTAPESLELRLAPALTLSGTVSLDGDVKAPFENMRVMLNPLVHRFPSQPNAQVQKDGSFTLSGVVPGRWRLVVGGAGYVKSVSLDQQQVSPSLVDIPAGFAGPLKIVIGTKWAQVEGTISGAPAEASQVSGLLWPAEEERQQSGLERAFISDAQGRFNLGGLPPGRYYACAVSIAEPWALMQNGALLNAIKSRCAALELAEGGRTTAQVPFIPARELEQLAEDADN